MNRALSLLLSSKGFPTKDKVANLIGMKMQGGAEWPEMTITGSLPLTYESRTERILKNYLLHGTSEGAGEKTANLFDKDDKGAGYNDGYYLTNNAQHMSANSNWAISAYMPVTQRVTYVVWWSMYETISASAPSIEFYTARQSSTRISMTRYEDRGHFLITAPSGANYARISFYKANKDFTTFAPSDTMITEPIPYGYSVPLTVTSGEQSQDVPIYIGSTKLYENEYLDYESGKVWKMVEGTLTPTDPPVPFPEILTYQGENTLSSTETLGEVEITGRIKPIET